MYIHTPDTQRQTKPPLQLAAQIRRKLVLSRTVDARAHDHRQCFGRTSVSLGQMGYAKRVANSPDSIRPRGGCCHSLSAQWPRGPWLLFGLFVLANNARTHVRFVCCHIKSAVIPLTSCELRERNENACVCVPYLNVCVCVSISRLSSVLKRSAYNITEYYMLRVCF